MTDRGPNRPATSQRLLHHSAEDVRGGEIILRKPWQRAVFIAGLAGVVVLSFFIG